MKLKMYAVYDSKVETYAQPFFLPTNGAAIRSWIGAVNDETTMFAKHPEDYTLFELGEYDDETGKTENLHTPKSLGTALEYKKSTPNIGAPRKEIQ